MSAEYLVDDIADESEEDDDINSKLVKEPTPSQEETQRYVTMEDIAREGDLVNEGGGNLALYEDELRQKPRISQLLSKLAVYEPVPSNPSGTTAVNKKSNTKKKVKMGTIMGVYLPTLQNILGVILFLRLTWIVGTAGVGQSLIIILLCCCCTLLTAISMSAIATNGVVPAGGSYFMISRNLGPEFGGAVGVLFYLGTSFAVSLYVLGAIELLLKHIAPAMSLFGDVTGDPNILYNNMRVYGTILLLLLSIVVFIGVRYVNYFATCALVCVIVAMVSIYAGALSTQTELCVCTLDGVALKGASDMFKCPKIKRGFCHTPLDSLEEPVNNTCSPDNPALLEAFRNTRFVFDNTSLDMLDWVSSEPQCSVGIPGISHTSTIMENGGSHYLEQGEVHPGVEGVGLQLSAQVTSSFFILISIFFPSVTGIMAGSNRSGDLKDAQKSIPIGTIAAILTTSLIYITCVLLFGGAVAGFALRDQFGDAIGGLIVAELAWPTKWLILLGALLSTVGAGLQSLTGAPRLLQAIARDNLIPFLKMFGYSSAQGEPTYALIMTAIMSEFGVLIASVDAVAPILSMFFLMCYMFVNVACALQSLLQAPNWRPRFKYYHWTLSTAGAVLCLAMMFISSWYFALVALVIAVVIYQYIAYRGAEKEWGDGMRGLSLQAARYSLLRLEEGPLHTKNWRPQLLVLIRLHPSQLTPSQPNLLSFASQLKAGKGLTMVTSVLEGNIINKVAEVKAAKETLKRVVDTYKIQGFCKVLAVPDVNMGLAQIIQGSGLGGLVPNTVLLSWPDAWRKKQSWKAFIETVRVVMATEKALIVTKGINGFPSSNEKCRGNIDIWWVVHDGGLLMLLPFLLRQHKVWRQCHLRIFTVARILSLIWLHVLSSLGIKLALLE
ncbi:solute carrier family 12 member 4-like isoform X4 [Dysidea avara]|uniref:solute carrier family 12 member 4-like isoform X4 n=1 Tax=Dysidea avara TaxID=196820 RepID=UPI00332AF6F4